MAYNPNNNYHDESDKEGFLKELEWAYNICFKGQYRNLWDGNKIVK